MERKEFVKWWKKALKMKRNNELVFIELHDGSVMRATRYVRSKNFRGHITLFLDKQVVGHIPICSVVDVF